MKKTLKQYTFQLTLLITTLFTFSAKPVATINVHEKAQQLIDQLSSGSSAIKQRALFVQIIMRALWKHTINQNNYTLIEEKLLNVYNKLNLTNQKNKEITQAVNQLITAINKNELISITPQEFLLGASSSASQVEGGLDPTSAAARFYAKNNMDIAGDAIDFYHRYKTDIEQMKNELHINSYRLSIAWNRIEPQQGHYSNEGINFYKDLIQTLIDNNIQPMVVFHHYDVPTWFEDLGGFEKLENAQYFKEFCLYFYTELAQELSDCLISMCNAPEGPAFKGYFTGEGTPGEKDNLHKTHTVIANMYYALVDTALAIKEKAAKLRIKNTNIKTPKIGTQLNVLPLDPHPSSQNTWKNRLKTSLGSEIASYVQVGGTYNFLVNGEYRMYTPDKDFMKQARGANVYLYYPDAYKAFDWFGVNIYSNNFLNGFKRINGEELIEEDEERTTDNANYRNYPEGIYRAVQMIYDNIAAPLGKLRNKNGKPMPIIVTENGIATKDDAKRTRYFQKALATITELIQDGYPVVGYLPWTSHDNYEWPTPDRPKGFGQKNYGFFRVNMDKASPEYLKRTLKEGSKFYANFAEKLFNNN